MKSYFLTGYPSVILTYYIYTYNDYIYVAILLIYLIVIINIIIRLSYCNIIVLLNRISLVALFDLREFTKFSRFLDGWSLKIDHHERLRNSKVKESRFQSISIDGERLAIKCLKTVYCPKRGNVAIHVGQKMIIIHFIDCKLLNTPFPSCLKFNVVSLC